MPPRVHPAEIPNQRVPQDSHPLDRSNHVRLLGLMVRIGVVPCPDARSGQ